MVGFTNDSEAVEQTCTRLKTAGRPQAIPRLQTQCSHGRLQKKLICWQASLHKRGGGGRSPPVCKHTARMVNGGGSKRLILRMASFKNAPEAVNQAYTRLKTAGGWGGAAHPLFANTMLAWLVSKTLRGCQASLHKQGVGAPICKHTARIGEWRGLRSLPPSSPLSMCTSSSPSSACVCKHA